MASSAVALASLLVVLSPQQSRIAFTLDATAHTVEGTIPLASGTIRVDPASGRASGEVVLDLRRAQTGNARRDRDMHDRVLETARFPTAVFRPRQVQGRVSLAGTSEVTLRGSLLFHGKEHLVDLPAKVTMAGGRLTAEGRLSIPYVAWGLTDPSKFVLRVGKTVEVSLRVVGELKE